MPVYLKLFHARIHPDEKLDDWSFEGPLLGPFDSVGSTYMTTLRCASPNGLEETELEIVGGMIHLYGAYYGDWAAIRDMSKEDKEDLALTQKVMKCLTKDLPTMIGIEKWIDLYIEFKLKEKA